MTSTEEINNMLEDKLQTYYKNSLKIMLKKICGYETLYLFSERETCLDLIKKIDNEYPSYRADKQNEYWITDRDDKEVVVPRESVKLTDFFRDKNVAAIYPLPTPTVYRVWFDDHHPHDHCIESN